MPGIPLLNLGTALGGLAGGWNQARSQGLQQAIQQLALQQQQGLTNQQTLAGLALQAGLLNQPGGGQTPLGQSFPSPQQPPNVNIANITPPAQSSSGGGAPPGYAPPLSPGGPTAPGDMTSADEVQLNADAGQDQFGATNQAIQAAGFGNQTASSGGSDATPTSTPTPTPLPTQIERGSGVSGTTPAQSADSGQQSGGGVGIQLPNGQVIDMSTMFRSMDYQKLAQGIAALAPPGTSQADIYGAVVDLAKLGEGDKVQQQQAGLLLRALTNGEFKLAGINAQGAIRSGQIAQQGAIRSGQIAQQGDIKSGQITQQGNIRSGIQTQKDAAAEQRQKERLAQQAAQFNQRLNQASRIANTTAKDTQLRALLGDIDKQLNPGGFSVPPQGDELLQLQRERVQIVNELRKLQGLPPVAMPQAPASQ